MCTRRLNELNEASSAHALKIDIEILVRGLAASSARVNVIKLLQYSIGERVDPPRGLSACAVYFKAILAGSLRRNSASMLRAELPVQRKRTFRRVFILFFDPWAGEDSCDRGFPIKKKVGPLAWCRANERSQRD